jgi:hypothetical protein
MPATLIRYNQVVDNTNGKPVEVIKPGTVEPNFVQRIKSARWVCNHNLGVMPNITPYSLGGREMLAQVQHINLNQSVITFDQPVAGYAIYSA